MQKLKLRQDVLARELLDKDFWGFRGGETGREDVGGFLEVTRPGESRRFHLCRP